MASTRSDWLQQVPIFGALSDDSVRFLLARSREVEVPAGGYFFRENETASAMYVLDAGRAVVLKGWHGAAIELRHLEPGDCFGEMALLDLFPRSASIRALDDCSAIELTPGGLLQLFEHDAGQFAMIQMNIGRELCRRLRATDELLFRSRMAGEPAEARTPACTT